MATGVIPARLKSTRLDEKVLKEIGGRPMIYHVWKRAKEASGLNEVIVACDDERIKSCVEGFGGQAVMTRADHPNGTSRIAEAAEKISDDILVNIQGDEPFIDPENINRLVSVLEKDSSLPVATLAVRKDDPEELQNPNVVKVVCGTDGNALYFSRSPVPFDRAGTGKQEYLKHLGIYAYRKSFLLEFVTWGTSPLEETEKLEQLRVLENGYKIRVEVTASDSLGIDTAEDLKAAESQFSAARAGRK